MRRSLGFQLWQVQNGLEPDDWKPMPTIGPGIREVRVSGTEVAYRAFYLATLPELVHVYHVFEKEDAEDVAAGPRDRKAVPQGAHAAEFEMNKTYASIWDAIEDTPEQAAEMQMRADAMIAIKQKVKTWNITQREAAKRLGVTQPRLNDLLQGRINNFSLDALVALSARAGLRPTMVFLGEEDLRAAQ